MTVQMSIAAVLCALLVFKPSWFIYAFSYGGRLKYEPPSWMVIFTRLVAAFVLVGAIGFLVTGHFLF